MTPVDFVVFDGDSTPNMPACLVAEAMTTPIRVFTGPGKEAEVVGYYYSDKDKCFVLDVE